MDDLERLAKHEVHPTTEEAPSPTAQITKATQLFTGETLDIPLRTL